MTQWLPAAPNGASSKSKTFRFRIEGEQPHQELLVDVTTLMQAEDNIKLFVHAWEPVTAPWSNLFFRRGGISSMGPGGLGRAPS